MPKTRGGTTHSGRSSTESSAHGAAIRRPTTCARRMTLDVAPKETALLPHQEEDVFY